MRVIVPEVHLRLLLGSRTRLEQCWATDASDAMVLLQSLQAGGSTLADVLGGGFVFIDPEPSEGRLSLRHRQALGTVETLNDEGNQVRRAQQHLQQVAVVVIHQLSVRGIPAVRRSA